MKLAIVVLACLAVVNAHTHAYWAHHGHDDGQWHGEGLWESQDWANHHHGHHAAYFAPHAAIVAPSTHGVVGHHGAVVAHGHHGGWVNHHHHW